MARYLTLTNDATAGGSSYDDLVAGAIPAPAAGAADALVVTSAQVDPGVRTLDRDDDVGRGRRAASQPISFASAPSLTYQGRAWTELLKRVLPKAMGGAPSSSGVAPAAVSTTFGMAQSGNLPALIAHLVREGQVDRLTGLWINEISCDFPTEGEGTMDVSLMGLYHDVDDVATVAGLPTVAGVPAQQVAYMLRDITAIMGDGAGVPIPCLAGFGFTINNNLLDDAKLRYCADKNVVGTTLDGRLRRIWYPERNKLGPQIVTGRYEYGAVQPDRELRRILTHSEKLVVELSADPISPATTPPADQMLRLTFYKQAPTGGGPDPLAREGEPAANYEFTAYIDDATGKDLEATFVDKSPALTLTL